MRAALWRSFCCCFLPLLLASATRADDWPQWRGPQRDGVWRESGVVRQFDSEKLPVKWRAPLASGYSGPTVAAGRVFVMDRLVEPMQQERIHCVDAETGQPLWSHAYQCPYVNISYDCGPRCSVTVDGARAYALGAMGNLHCLDAAEGKVLWHRDLNREYEIRMPIWGIAASPLVEGDLLVVQIGGRNNACLVALDKLSGNERWRSLPDECSYSPPIVIEQAGRRVLVCWTGDNVVGLEPQTGKPLWSVPSPPIQDVAFIATPALEPPYLFVSSFYNGSLMLRLDGQRAAAEKAWESSRNIQLPYVPESLHALMTTPYIKQGHIYAADNEGQLVCLRADSGQRCWETQQAVPKARFASLHMVQHGEDTWILNERGELIIAQLTPEGYQERSRAFLIEPTTDQFRSRGGVVWAHPAFANRAVYARNDKELVCASLSG